MMGRSIALALVALAFANEANAAEAIRRVPFKALPQDAQSTIRTELESCGVDPERESVGAYPLDANNDFHTDFLVDAAELSRPCAASWVPRWLYVYRGDGTYLQVTLGSDTGLLRNGEEFIFTLTCGASPKWDGASLAVLDRDKTELAPFGRCYPSVADAIKAAKSRGYRLTTFER